MKTILAVLLLVSSMAQANFSLADNGRKLVCTADDNQTFEIDPSRTRMKYTVEGESLGLGPL